MSHESESCFFKKNHLALLNTSLQVLSAHEVNINLVISFHAILYAFKTICVGVMPLKSIIRLQRVIRQALRTGLHVLYTTVSVPVSLQTQQFVDNGVFYDARFEVLTYKFTEIETV